MNIVDLVKNQLGSDVVGPLGSVLGTSGQETRSAVDAAVPALLAGLSHLAGTPDGARKVAAAVNSADDSAVGNITSALTSGSSGVQQAIQSGTGMLSSLFGGNMISSLGSVLSRFTGLGTGAIASLLGLLGPSIFGILKGYAQKTGTDAGGVANLLASQKQNILGALPSGLGNMLGGIPGLGALGNLTGRAGEAAHATYDAGRNAAREGAAVVRDGARAAGAGASSAMSWVLPVLGILALGSILWWAFSGRTQPATHQVSIPAPAPVAVDTRDATLAAANLPAAAEQITVVKDQVTGFFKSATETIGGITDSASAEAALPKLRDLNTSLDTIKNGIGALPADARTQVTSLFSDSFGKIKPVIDRLMNNPSISDKIKPVVDEIVRKANGLIGM